MNVVNPIQEFKTRNDSFIEKAANDLSFKELTDKWFLAANSYEYSYHFTALGRPIIQYPQDMVAMQEIIWEVKPDLIVEMGIAHGGSLILNASMLAMLDYCEAAEKGETLNPKATKRKVLGVDIDIRPHNRAAIQAHPVAHHIEMFEGSSIEEEMIAKVRNYAADFKNVMVILDSNHTHDHVLTELEAYADLTSVGSYCIVFDTVIEDLPDEMWDNRPWKKGNNPKTAVWEYLKTHPEFEIDKKTENRLMITVAPDGYLKRVR